MRVAMNLSFAVNKKEPLAEMMSRIRQSFLASALGEPTIRFTLVGTAIDRVLKRFPEMERFLAMDPLIPGGTDWRILSNSKTGEPVDYATLESTLAGVPRSFPLNSVWLHFHAPLFGERLIGLPRFGDSLPGVWITDNRWLGGRQRAIAIYTIVDADFNAPQLPPNPQPVDALIKAFGKVQRTAQVGSVGSVPPENAAAVKAIAADYRARLKEIVERAGLPHALPPAADIRAQNVGVTAGPRKPPLDAAFKPMGYTCRGGTGQFHLTRRTSTNLTIELYLDVGTWSHSVSAIFLVYGAGFRESLAFPFAVQYPIGDADQWQKIVENLAAMVRELDRTFVPEVEKAAGPTPAWYRPNTL
jgi:hypothetical protein